MIYKIEKYSYTTNHNNFQKIHMNQMSEKNSYINDNNNFQKIHMKQESEKISYINDDNDLYIKTDSEKDLYIKNHDNFEENCVLYESEKDLYTNNHNEFQEIYIKYPNPFIYDNSFTHYNFDIICYISGQCTGGFSSHHVGGLGIYSIIIIKNDEIIKQITEKVLFDNYMCYDLRSELYSFYKLLLMVNLSKQKKILIYTPSKYIIGCFTQWINYWIENNWKTLHGNNVDNQDLLKSIISTININKLNISYLYTDLSKDNFYIHNSFGDSFENMN